MDSNRFAMAVAVRAAALAGLFFALIELLATTRLYATALIIAGGALYVIVDLARHASHADRVIGRFVDSLRVGEFEYAVQSPSIIFRETALALEHAVDALNQSRAARQREVEYLQALLDNVATELFVIEDTGAVGLVNRAARKFARRAVGHLHEISALSEDAAGRVMALAPGNRSVIRLRNGQRVLASAALFATGGTRRKLISLQGIETELDSVEIAAWQNLARILAHEMMNSLTPIVSLAASVQPAVRRLVEHTDSSASGMRLEEIDTAIDAIARRSAGLMRFVDRYRKLADLPTPAIRTLQLAEVVGRIDQLIRATMEEKGIKYSSLVVPPDLAIPVDPDLFEQALINLIHNAIDAVEGVHEPGIEVRCTSREGEVAIAIIDNGRGVDPELVGQIFVPFFSTKPRGLGIGLALARQIALAHHGVIEVEGRNQAGAIFTLVIPAT
jgi:two-component system nitrogen regulation sensor histidine kinase NtrY